jgi:hypothetical protein
MRKVLVGGTVALVLAPTLTATPAFATSVTVDCGELQGALNAASAGEVITLDELCKSGFPYKLPSVPVTLTGRPGAGFDGGSTAQLENGQASATVEHLSFENANNAGGSFGGCLSLSSGGSALDFTLAEDSFTDDTVSGSLGKGGGADVETTGAVKVEESSFIDDRASATEATGGGLNVYAAVANLSGDTFIGDSTASNGFGGGLYATLDATGGGPHDVLSLANTIVDGDSGGSELGGFSALANITAAYSDLCSGASPFAGVGNICADPQLVGPGPGSADVHETPASPTLGAGSNALVPSGLSTDTYGNPRISGPQGCGSIPAPVVDIGAAEFVYPFPTCAPPVGGGSTTLAAPVLSSLGESAKTWREGSALAQLSSADDAGRHKAPVGTTFSFTLNEPAQVKFTFNRLTSGRRVGKKCVAQTSRNKRRRRCTRTLSAGTLAVSAPAGTDKLRFDGVIAKHHRLAPGSYTLLVTASVSGRDSFTRVLHFTIVG